MLRKYTPYLTHVVDWGKLVVDVDETFEEGPVRIMDSSGPGFARQHYEDDKSVMVALRSGRGNMGMRGHVMCQLSFLV